MEKKIKKISFSEYQVWKSCQHKHYLSYQLRISDLTNEILIFGKALHSALEKYAKGEFNRIVFKKKFGECLKNEVESSNNKDIKIDYEKFSKQGETIFQKLDFLNRFKEYEVFSVEEMLLEKLIDSENEDEIVFYKGFVDLILKHKKTGHYLIIDWKSAMRPWNIDKKMEDKVFFGQLVLYRHFISKKFNIPKDQIETKFITLIRFGTKSVETFQTNISEEFDNFILEDIKKVSKEIITKKDKFIKRRTEGKLSEIPCKYCSFKNTDKCNEEPFQNYEPPITWETFENKEDKDINDDIIGEVINDIEE